MYNKTAIFCESRYFTRTGVGGLPKINEIFAIHLLGEYNG